MHEAPVLERPASAKCPASDKRQDGEADVRKFATTTGALALGFALALPALADSPPSALDRGHGQQTWQNPGYAQLVAFEMGMPNGLGGVLHLATSCA